MTRITAEMFHAYEGVRQAGYYNMLDPRARALANEMNDLNITRGDWAFITMNYSELRTKYFQPWME